MSKKISNFRKVERLVKGFSNHRRIQIMELLKSKPELSLIEIAGELKINFKTAAQHIFKLVISGLVIKRSDGASVRHKLTGVGNDVLLFLRTIE